MCSSSGEGFLCSLLLLWLYLMFSLCLFDVGEPVSSVSNHDNSFLYFVGDLFWKVGFSGFFWCFFIFLGVMCAFCCFRFS